MIARLRSSPRRMRRAASSALITKGFTLSKDLVIGVSTNPGQMTLTDTPSAS